MRGRLPAPCQPALPTCMGLTASPARPRGPPSLPLPGQCAYERAEAQPRPPGSLEEQYQCWGPRPLAELPWCFRDLLGQWLSTDSLSSRFHPPPASSPSREVRGSPRDRVLPAELFVSPSSRPRQVSRRTWSRRSSTTTLKLPSLTSL